MNSTLASLPSWLQARLRQRGNTYPSYVTDTWDLSCWREILKGKLGLDDGAFALLLELNNCSVKGQECANNVIAGLLKKRQDAVNPLARKIDNVNAWLTSTCKKMLLCLKEEKLDAGSRPNRTSSR